MELLKNPSKLTKSVVESIPATTAMTAFSYGLSRILNKQFREPELLSYLVYEQPLVSLTRNYKWANKTTGFLLHYLAGVGFATGYEYLWKPAIKLPTLLKGAAYGVVAGLAGAAVWEATVSLRKTPPRLEKPEYYTHLILAHVVFGATTALISNNVKKQV